MNQNVFIIATGVVFLLIIIAVLYFAFKPTPVTHTANKTEETAQKKKRPVSTASATLEEIIDMAKSAQRAGDLKNIVLSYLQTTVLPARSGKNLSPDAKKKLSFITAVCSNPLADAQLISFLVIELEKRYPAYRAELEMYQNMGIAKRRMSR